MAENEFDLPDILLEKSLLIKKAARRIFDQEIKTHMKKREQAENEEKLRRVRAKKADERTAAEFLFLMNETIEHAYNCANFGCDWAPRCWRMKGMLFHADKLRDDGRLTPAAMVTLWNRHLDLEMHTESCPNPETCARKCRDLDQYKYFFMKCVSDLRNGKIVPFPEGTEGSGMRPGHLLYPVFIHFRKQLEKRYNERKDMEDKERRSAYHLLGKIISGDYGEKARASAAERDRRRAAAAKTAAAVVAAEAAAGQKLMVRLPGGEAIPLKEAAKRGLITDSAHVDSMLAACVKKKENEKAEREEIDPSQPGSSTQPPPPKNKPVKCDHAPERRCNHAFNEKIVDLQLGTREELVRNRENKRSPPSKEVIEILRSRIAQIVEMKGIDRCNEPSRVNVRVITVTINGVRWTVAFNGGIHNLYDFDRFSDCVSKLMFAVYFYRDVQVVMYNFLPEKGSEGQQRMEALMGDLGVDNIVTVNLNHTPKTATDIMSQQLNINYKVAQKKWKADTSKRSPKEIFWSGCYVRFNGKGVHEHFWKDNIARDRTHFAKIIAHHGLKSPSETYTHMKEPSVKREKPDYKAEFEAARIVQVQQDYVVKTLAQRKVLKTTTTMTSKVAPMAAADKEALLAIGDKLKQMKPEQYKHLMDGMEAMKSMQEKHGSNFMNLLAAGEKLVQFTSPEAKMMQQTRSFPVDANGVPYIPAELVQMCTKIPNSLKPSTSSTFAPPKATTSTSSTQQPSSNKRAETEDETKARTMMQKAMEEALRVCDLERETNVVKSLMKEEKKTTEEEASVPLDDEDGIEWLSDESVDILETDSELDKVQNGSMGVSTSER